MAQSGIFQFFHIITTDLFAIQKSAASQTCRIKIIQNWIVDNSNANLFFPYKCNRNGNKWNVTNKIIGAINRINDPCWIFGQSTVRCFRFLSNESEIFKIEDLQLKLKKKMMIKIDTHL